VEGIAEIARIAVGVVLIAAGVLKLVEGPGWLKQAADMGVARPLALVVSYVELVIGALLVVGLFMPWTAVAALGLLAAFTYVIVKRLRDGSRPPCACFGSGSKRPLGAYHVARNLALVLVAVVAVVWR
jgi:uncharacterized membrane protein YphA (DoxX/SURF4 family)